MAQEFRERCDKFNKDLESITHETYYELSEEIQELQEIAFENKDDYFNNENDYLITMELLLSAYNKIERYKPQGRRIVKINFGLPRFRRRRLNQTEISIEIPTVTRERTTISEYSIPLSGITQFQNHLRHIDINEFLASLNRE